MLLSEMLQETVKEEEIRRRFMSHVVTTPNSCWIWKYAHRGDGEFYLTKDELRPSLNHGEGKRVGARRLMYLLTYREIPNGRKIKTSCGVRACVNPAHLEVVE